MKHKVITILFVSIFSISLANAGSGNAINHDHGGRTHSHPLPSIGINHSHGKKAQKTPKGWVLLGETEGNNVRFEGKTNSYELTNTRKGTRIAKIIVRQVDPVSHQISIYQRYVSLNDCKRKRGKIVAVDMDNNYKFENDFIIGGGSIGSSVAETICSIAKDTIDKGL